MNTLQRLLSNTALAFLANLIVKASSSLLFIAIGRRLGPVDAGLYNLGITYFTIVFALSAWGLQELLVREVAPRRGESGRYLVNYLALRLALAAVAFGLLLAFLRLALPYTPETKLVIRILALAIFPEAVFGLCQALFAAHERLTVPTLAAFVNSALKLGGGLWLLYQGAAVTAIAWVIPLGSALSLLVFAPALAALWRRERPSAPARLSLSFSRAQLAQTPGFVLIHLFSLLDFQTDTFLISLFLGPADIAFYGAAQTIMLAFWMLPVAVRTAVYPIMARFYHRDRERLALFYRKTFQYLLAAALPAAAGVFLLAGPIIDVVFGADFAAATPALQWTIWAIVFALLNVPSARLMLVYDRQRAAGWLTGLSMGVNIILNLLLIPRFGIVGAAMARLLATAVFFAAIHVYVQRLILPSNLLPYLARPALATAIMAAVVWPLRDVPLLWPVLAGALAYAAAGLALGLVPRQDRVYWRQLLAAPARGQERAP